MNKWQKEYPIDFSPFGDTQGSAVDKQDQEFDVIYEKLNKILKHRYDNYSTATDLERGEIITKSGYKVTVNESGKQVIINILKNGSVENDSNDNLNNLGCKKFAGRIPTLDFRSEIIGGYIKIAKLASSPEPYAIAAPDANKRGIIEVSLHAAKLLPSCVLPYTRDYYNNDTRPYPSYWRYRGVEERKNKNTIYYSAQNNYGIYVIRYYFKFADNHNLLFYIQEHQSDNSIYYMRNYWNTDNTKVITHSNGPYIVCSPSSSEHTGEIIYSPHPNIRTAALIGTCSLNNKWPAYLGGGRWRNTGSNIKDYLGYTWSGQEILHGIIIMEKVAW